MKTTIRELLNKLHATKINTPLIALQEELVAVLPEYEGVISAAINNFVDRTVEQEDVMKSLESEIKQLTVEHGETVQGMYNSAVICGGRVTWDTKALDGYAVSNPDILEFRKVGKPYVAIRGK